MDGSSTGAELRQFIERIETIEGEIKAAQDDRKEVYAELKGRGFDGKAVAKIVARRKRSRDEIEEEEAIMSLYLSALGDV